VNGKFICGLCFKKLESDEEVEIKTYGKIVVTKTFQGEHSYMTERRVYVCGDCQ